MNVSVATWVNTNVTVKPLQQDQKIQILWAPKRKQDDVGCWERPARPFQ